MSRTKALRICSGLSALALTCLVGVAQAAPAALTRMGSGGLDTAPSGLSGNGPEFAPQPVQDNPLPAGTLSVPTPNSASVTNRVPHSVLGASGLNHHDQRTADNGHQFSLEPPDQGLCVGNGYVIEAVNNVIRVRSAATNAPMGGVTSLSRFFGFGSEFDRSQPAGAPRFGPFLSDPKCVYDVDTKRFFVTELAIATDPVTDAFTGPTAIVIAVSTSSDPTQPFAVFVLSTTNDGSNGITHPNCPCLPDQPLIGLDSNGLYISTNEFSVFGNGFNGSQLYGISKQKLAAAADGATGAIYVGYVNAGGLATPDVGGVWYSVQPASYTPNEDDSGYNAEASAHNGVEYFLSALEFFGVGDTRVALWALTNTNSLQTNNPQLGVQIKTITTQTFYTGPGNLNQKGSTGQIQSNDDRMNQVTKNGNTLFGAVNTALSDSSGAKAGIAYWGIKPHWNHNTLSGSVAVQGYVAVNGDSVVFPSIAMNRDGVGMMAFSLIGPDYYPSAAFVRFSNHGGANGPVVVAGAGVAPYASFGVVPGVSAGRWGDYSAVADDTGNVWGAAEYIPTASFGAAANGGLANWGTFVWRYTPDN